MRSSFRNDENSIAKNNTILWSGLIFQVSVQVHLYWERHQPGWIDYQVVVQEQCNVLVDDLPVLVHFQENHRILSELCINIPSSNQNLILYRQRVMAKVKIKHIESDLEGLLSFSNPDIKLEQYQTPPRFAAEVIHLINTTDSIANKTILDLGCGCGILGFGCARLSAARVIGVDIDDSAIAIAMENRDNVGLEEDTISFLPKDVLSLVKDDFISVSGFDMVIMNPPFGTKKHTNMDTEFVLKGLELAKVVYSIHKSSTRAHWARAITQWNERRDWDIDMRVCLADKVFKLPRTYKFHKHQEQEIFVDLIRFSHKQIPT